MKDSEQCERELKEKICKIGRMLHESGMVASNDGNITVRLPDGNLLATPTGVSKGAMTPDMLLKVDLDGNVLEGTMKKTSELPLHLRAYKERPDINAAVHAHPASATAFACAGIPLEDHVLTEAVFALGSVPLAPYGTPSTQEVPDSIVPLIYNHDALLLEYHGVLTVGESLEQAYYNMETVEHYAKIVFMVRQLAPGRSIPQEKIAQLLKIREKACLPGRHPGLAKQY